MKDDNYHVCNYSIMDGRIQLHYMDRIGYADIKFTQMEEVLFNFTYKSCGGNVESIQECGDNDECSGMICIRVV